MLMLMLWVLAMLVSANAVRAGAANAATKWGVLGQCSVMHAGARESREFYDAIRQVGCLSKLAQKAAPGGLPRLPLGQAGR